MHSRHSSGVKTNSGKVRPKDRHVYALQERDRWGFRTPFRYDTWADASPATVTASNSFRRRAGGVRRPRLGVGPTPGSAALSAALVVEPVFGNIQNKGMRRFTMRGQIKVSAQWQLFTIVHNIEKIARVHRQ